VAVGERIYYETFLVAAGRERGEWEPVQSYGSRERSHQPTRGSVVSHEKRLGEDMAIPASRWLAEKRRITERTKANGREKRDKGKRTRILGESF